MSWWAVAFVQTQPVEPDSGCSQAGMLNSGCALVLNHGLWAEFVKTKSAPKVRERLLAIHEVAMITLGKWWPALGYVEWMK